MSKEMEAGMNTRGREGRGCQIKGDGRRYEYEREWREYQLKEGG